MVEQPAFLEVRSISKEYKDVKALNNVSFSIKKGEILGYIGPNGAGKTTTIKILVGLIQNYNGDIKIYENEKILKKQDFFKILGYLPQEVGFQEWRTVDHALKTFGRLSKIPEDQLNNRIIEVLKTVGLSDVRNKKIIHLSGGMQQKLRLAQALLHKPKLLILDEPMTGLDPTSRYQMKKIIKTLMEQNITIFFSSHILSDVQDIATRIGIINHGRILKIGTPEQLQNEFQ
ncbi:MAG: ABC transporter ATP-binding protein, partial [Promethearchaeota archaeon]